MLLLLLQVLDLLLQASKARLSSCRWQPCCGCLRSRCAADLQVAQYICHGCVTLALDGLTGGRADAVSARLVCPHLGYIGRRGRVAPRIGVQHHLVQLVQARTRGVTQTHKQRFLHRERSPVISNSAVTLDI